MVSSHWSIGLLMSRIKDVLMWNLGAAKSWEIILANCNVFIQIILAFIVFYVMHIFFIPHRFFHVKQAYVVVV